MKYSILLAALLPIATLAGMPSDPPPGVEPPSTTVAQGGDAHAGAISASGAIATGGNAQAEQSQTQAANADASNIGNAQTLSIQSRYEQKRQAPNVYAPAVYASGPCAYGWSAGAAIPGGGASFGRTKPDTNCDRRELARVLTPLNPHLALKLLCADPLVQALYRDNPQAAAVECIYIAPPVVTATDDSAENEPKASSDAPDPRYATKDELRRAFEQGQQK